MTMTIAPGTSLEPLPLDLPEVERRSDSALARLRSGSRHRVGRISR